MNSGNKMLLYFRKCLMFVTGWGGWGGAVYKVADFVLLRTRQSVMLDDLE